MANYKPLISPEEIKSNIIDNTFKEEKHYFYVVYDHLMDHFIIKLVPPDRLSSAYHISDSIALLIDPNTKEVVGYQLLEFSTEHLNDFKSFKKIWDDGKQQEIFGKYKKYEYDPARMKDYKDSNNSNYLLRLKPDRISYAVATC